ncbi:hypothetical protein N7454_005231 [Penicillium verhagenii]|nr:hypothetical protein N7454_005231 [Penicillium verhagenii]
MSDNAGYDANFSGTTPQASDKHSERALKEHDQDADQQTEIQVIRGTDLQYRPLLSDNKHAASQYNATQSQIDGITTNANTSTTRPSTKNDDHATSRDHVDDTSLPNIMQTFKDSSYKRGGVANGQKYPLVIDEQNQLETIIGDQVHDDVALTNKQTPHDKICPLVDGSSDQSAFQGDKVHDHIEALPCVNDYNNESPTNLSLHNKADGLVGASNGLSIPIVHHNINNQKIPPENLISGNKKSAIVANLEAHAYGMIESPLEAMKKGLNADSHGLAYELPDIRGAIQTEDPNGGNARAARDIGWHKANVEIPDPLIGGYTNGELFSLIRRFNKHVFDVKALPVESAMGLDLNDAWSQDHAADKMALHLQRFYLTWVLGLASIVKHISRLRSWKEACRTSVFCTIYFAAWLFDLLFPLGFGILILVVSSTKARNIIFPSAPRALVNTRTGGIQKPQAGLLGTNDTITGAPEKQLHEAIEEEAANFVKNLRHNIQRAIGMHNSQQQDGDGDPLERKIPKPISKAIKAVKSAGSAPGHVTESTDQTQQPMEEIIWAGVNPESIAKFLDMSPHLIGELADNWERCANALSPTPPFSHFAFLRILAVLTPLFLISLFANYYMVYKGFGCIIGFVFFGDPMLTPAIAWLKQNLSNYKELAQPKNNFLRGVPTNIQIAITILRIGEVHKTPLPPVPTSNSDDPDHPNIIDGENIPLAATRSDVLDATTPSTVDKTQVDDSKERPKHEHLSKIVRFFKGNAKSVVETKLSIDRIRAATGSQKSKDRSGVLPKTQSITYTGPNEYQCRFEGKHGWAVIKEAARSSLLFTRDDPRLMRSQNLESVFEIAVSDMKRIKRAKASVNTAIEAVASFSSDQKLLASLEIEDNEGKVWRLTAIPERDELFNRLVAKGNQKWENM